MEQVFISFYKVPKPFSVEKRFQLRIWEPIDVDIGLRTKLTPQLSIFLAEAGYLIR
jgi:hypothetical protein